MTTAFPNDCILCRHPDPKLFCEVSNRRYFNCDRCDLVFLDPRKQPNVEDERAEYAFHNNDSGDPRYRQHLAKLTEPLVKGLSHKAKGLDFGCGPGPAISVMLKELGYSVMNYDPYFAPNESLLKTKYDFISCTEVAEHFYDPHGTFTLLAALLKPGGRLGLMTQFRPKDHPFVDWYYTKEHSHVTFYNDRSFSWLAESHGWTIREMNNPLVIFEN
ncbi:class I SAM-dependent methyltransferase [Alphaproteobacteria bacterium]|nr:class I SAM-dependent methyltransferase [Alphaproteobacteria bacterium]